MNQSTPMGLVPDIEAQREEKRRRLDRLAVFLLQDPANTPLRIDAFETALACSAWERAAAYLEEGRARDEDALGWKLREGDFWLAQHRYDQARAVLETVPPSDSLNDVVLHNLAYIDLRQGRVDGCVERLADRMSADQAPITPSVAVRALQQLWLRALHHLGDLDRAIAWSSDAERMAQLAPQAAGVASLIALDASDFHHARRWSALAVAEGTGDDPTVVEALITQASLAMAARDGHRAREFAEAALARSPEEGRAWSAWAFAAMLSGDFAAARAAFARATSAMRDHIGTWHGKGWAELMLRDLAAAEASFREALALDGSFAESHGGLALVLAFQHRVPEAKACAERALRLDRQNLSGRYATAVLNGEIRDPADLQRLARQLLAGRPAPLGGSMADEVAGGPVAYPSGSVANDQREP